MVENNCVCLQIDFKEQCQMKPTSDSLVPMVYRIFALLPPIPYYKCSEKTKLRKHGNLGNSFSEPMSVSRNQLVRQGHNNKESSRLLISKGVKKY